MEGLNGRWEAEANLNIIYIVERRKEMENLYVIVHGEGDVAGMLYWS